MLPTPTSTNTARAVLSNAIAFWPNEIAEADF